MRWELLWLNVDQLPDRILKIFLYTHESKWENPHPSCKKARKMGNCISLLIFGYKSKQKLNNLIIFLIPSPKWCFGFALVSMIPQSFELKVEISNFIERKFTHPQKLGLLSPNSKISATQGSFAIWKKKMFGDTLYTRYEYRYLARRPLIFFLVREKKLLVWPTCTRSHI